MKILIIGPSWVGDMVMSQSLYITLKKKYANAIIDVMAPAWCRAILERMPEVNQAIEMPLSHGEFNFLLRRQLGRGLKKAHYDRAYVLPNSAKSALIPLFASIPIRTGWKGEMRYGLINDLRPDKKIFKYMVERYVALAFDKSEMNDSKSLGGLASMPYPHLITDTVQQQRSIKKHNLSVDKPIIGLCPGAEFGPAKRWPETHYAKVADEFFKLGYQVWIFGSEKDSLIAENIIALMDDKNNNFTVNLAGKTSLTEVIDLLACCKTVVSNDSGLMHIAAAVGCNVVAIYGSSSPEYTPPLTDSVQVLHTNISCRPCYKKQCPYTHLKCLTELPVTKVLEAVNRSFNNDLLIK